MIFSTFLTLGVLCLVGAYWFGGDHEKGDTVASKVLRTSTPFMTRNSIIFTTIHLCGWLALSAVWCFMRLPANSREPLEKLIGKISTNPTKVEFTTEPELVSQPSGFSKYFTPAHDDFTLLGLRTIVARKSQGYTIIFTTPEDPEKWVNLFKKEISNTKLMSLQMTETGNATYITPEVPTYLSSLIENPNQLAFRFFENFLGAIYLWVMFSALAFLGVASVFTLKIEKSRRLLLSQLLANEKFLVEGKQQLQKAVLEKRSALTDMILKFWGYFPTYWARPFIGGLPAIVMLDYEIPQPKNFDPENPDMTLTSVEGYLIPFEQKSFFSGLGGRPIFIPLEHWNALTKDLKAAA